MTGILDIAGAPRHVKQCFLSAFTMLLMALVTVLLWEPLARADQIIESTTTFTSPQFTYDPVYNESDAYTAMGTTTGRLQNVGFSVGTITSVTMTYSLTLNVQYDVDVTTNSTVDTTATLQVSSANAYDQSDRLIETTDNLNIKPGSTSSTFTLSGTVSPSNPFSDYEGGGTYTVGFQIDSELFGLSNPILTVGSPSSVTVDITDSLPEPSSLSVVGLPLVMSLLRRGRRVGAAR